MYLLTVVLGKAKPITQSGKVFWWHRRAVHVGHQLRPPIVPEPPVLKAGLGEFHPVVVDRAVNKQHRKVNVVALWMRVEM